VLEYEGCSSVQGGPRHAFRLLDGGGREIPFDPVAYTEHHVEITPRAPLRGGPVALWIRRPVAPDALGPWEVLARVTVAGAADATPPSFAGLLSAEARAIEGSVRLSPCESVPGWELETRVRFAAARDPGSAHDDLLYRLEQAAPGSDAWKEVTTLRPTPDGDGMSFHWRTEIGWSERWVYRMSVRDGAGHQTIGGAVVTVKNPDRPERELWSPPGARDAAPDAAPELRAPLPEGSTFLCAAAPAGSPGGAGLAALALAAAILRRIRVRSTLCPERPEGFTGRRGGGEAREDQEGE